MTQLSERRKPLIWRAGEEKGRRGAGPDAPRASLLRVRPRAARASSADSPVRIWFEERRTHPAAVGLADGPCAAGGAHATAQRGSGQHRRARPRGRQLRRWPRSAAALAGCVLWTPGPRAGVTPPGPATNRCRRICRHGGARIRSGSGLLGSLAGACRFCKFKLQLSQQRPRRWRRRPGPRRNSLRLCCIAGGLCCNHYELPVTICWVKIKD